MDCSKITSSIVAGIEDREVDESIVRDAPRDLLRGAVDGREDLHAVVLDVPGHRRTSLLVHVINPSTNAS